MNLYPFKLQPIYVPKPWGGHRLQSLHPDSPIASTERIGESWELADLPATDPSGAGGEPIESLIANGPLAGQSLRQLLEQFTTRITGSTRLTHDLASPTASSTSGGRFPLLIKYLDAADNLSVQVHPNAAYAAAHRRAHLKCEAWYIVAAEPGSMIYKGLAPGVAAQDVAAAVADGSLVDLLIKVPAHPGDCHYLPSGTVHALGAGVVVAEVQTPSDTTFRLFDWSRTGRTLHIEQALAAMTLGPVDIRHTEPGHLLERGPATVEVLVTCEHFTIEKVTAPAGSAPALPADHRPHVWMVLAGSGSIECGSGGLVTTDFSPGDTLLFPADLADPRLTLTTHAEWLHITAP